MAVTSLGFIATPIVAGFDHRLEWSQMPAAVALGGEGLMLLGWLAVFFVFKENSFASATIEVAPDQKVISTGPYALVRHPMYSGGLVLLFAIPIALGSWWGVLIMGALLPALVWRLFDEEKFLTRNLPGYTEYQRQVRYRLVPGVW
jgi:protein-S-isoprenylcysteine O-methyltransferase Ste14